MKFKAIPLVILITAFIIIFMMLAQTSLDSIFLFMFLFIGMLILIYSIYKTIIKTREDKQHFD